MLSFESTASGLNPNDDPYSPYVEDPNGDIYLKHKVQRDGAGELSDDDIDDDRFEY